jgi:hypothetical protein
LLPSGIGSEKDRETKTRNSQTYQVYPEISDAELYTVNAFFGSELQRVDLVSFHRKLRVGLLADRECGSHRLNN